MIQQLKNKKILITGGTGFIGKELLKEFSLNNIECYVLTRQDLKNYKSIKFIKCDLNYLSHYPKELEKIEFDYCIYLAANIPVIGAKKENYLEAKESTLDPLIKFLTYFKKNIKKIIYISSIDILGKVSKENYTEEEESNLPTPYGLAKYCGELYVKNICQLEGIQWNILRFSQVFGSKEPLVRVIPILIDSIEKEKEFILYTTGEERRRFLYIKDAIKSIICACISDINNRIYNIAGKNSITINDLIFTIEKEYNKKLKIVRKNEILGISNIPNIKKAENELKFNPDYTVEEGIKEIIKGIINGK